MFGRYRLVSELGRGGMGVVYRARDTEHDDREVALKVLAPHLVADEEYRKRFRQEAQIAARLTEPPIVPVHHYGDVDGTLFLEMRLVEGTDLATVLQRAQSERRRLDPAEAVHVVEQVASALDAAHREDLVHRDIKPSNVLVHRTHDDSQWFAYLCDFGIARRINSTSPTLTNDGAMIGTAAYMAPERFGYGPVDGRADVYSLTCLLHEVLTGARPFPYDDPFALMRAHDAADPPRPSERGLPLAMDAVVARGMAKKPDQRYAAAGELARAARNALVATPFPVALPPVPLPPVAPTPSPRNPAPPATIADPDPPLDPVTDLIPGPGPERGPLPGRGSRLLARVADPWAAVVAASAGGLAWAVQAGNPLAVPLGFGVAAIVFVAKIVGDAVLGGPPEPPASNG